MAGATPGGCWVKALRDLVRRWEEEWSTRWAAEEPIRSPRCLYDCHRISLVGLVLQTSLTPKDSFAGSYCWAVKVESLSIHPPLAWAIPPLV